MATGTGKTKKVIRRNLPLNTTYKIIDSYYTGGLLENPHTCENCGAPIANVAVIENAEQNKFEVGMDCASTLSGIKDSPEFNLTDANFNEAAAIRKKIQTILKKKNNIPVFVSNVSSGKISVVIKDDRDYYFNNEFEKDFVFKYLPELKNKIQNPEKNDYMPKYSDSMDFGFDFSKITPKGPNNFEFSVGEFTVKIVDGVNIAPSGQKNYQIDINVFKGDLLIDSESTYMPRDAKWKALKIINNYEFEKYSPALSEIKPRAETAAQKGKQFTKDRHKRKYDVWYTPYTNDPNVDEAEGKKARKMSEDMLIDLAEDNAKEYGITFDVLDIDKAIEFLQKDQYIIKEINPHAGAEDAEIIEETPIEEEKSIVTEIKETSVDGTKTDTKISTENLNKLRTFHSISEGNIKIFPLTTDIMHKYGYEFGFYESVSIFKHPVQAYKWQTELHDTVGAAFKDLLNKLKEKGLITQEQISEVTRTFSSIKDCLLSDTDNENDYIVEGTRIFNTTSSGTTTWVVQEINDNGLTLRFMPESPLDPEKPHKDIEWEELRKLFQENKISISGIHGGDLKALNHCIKAIENCYERLDMQSYYAAVIDRINELKQQDEKIRNGIKPPDDFKKKTTIDGVKLTRVQEENDQTTIRMVKDNFIFWITYPNAAYPEKVGNKEAVRIFNQKFEDGELERQDVEPTLSNTPTIEDYQNSIAGAETALEFADTPERKQELEDYIGGLKLIIESLQ